MADEAKISALMLEAVRLRGREKVVDVEEEKVKLVVFSLSGGCYAFNGSYIKEILPNTRIFFVPGVPGFILGVINVRGDIESVISINRFLGLAEEGEAPQNGRILIAEKNGLRTGIMVDAIEDVRDFPLSSIKLPISTLDKEKKWVVSGETMLGGQSVAILDAGGILEKIAAESGAAAR